MAQCLGDGDPLTAKDTGDEMSNESLEIEDEDSERYKEFNHKIRKKVKASKRIIVVILRLT